MRYTVSPVIRCPRSHEPMASAWRNPRCQSPTPSKPRRHSCGRRGRDSKRGDGHGSVRSCHPSASDRRAQGARQALGGVPDRRPWTGTVSTGVGDAGGVSYGSYQMTSKNGGTVLRFVSQPAFPWLGDFRGLSPGSPEFTAKWKAIAAATPSPFMRRSMPASRPPISMCSRRTLSTQTGWTSPPDRPRCKTSSGRRPCSMGPMLRLSVGRWRRCGGRGSKTWAIAD